MLCPVCHTDNLDDAIACSSCTSSLNFGLGQTPVPPVPKSDFPGFDAPTLPPSQTVRPSVFSAGNGSAAAAALGAIGSAPAPDFGPRYRVEGKLGEGGMGSVYKAQDLELDRPVALKVIRQELMANAEILQRFKQELLLASRISHKNILRIHDLGEGVGVKFISMAYIQGRNLAEVLQEQKVLPLEKAIEIAKQICRALAAAHQEEVVHRDLKPQNILLDKDDCVYVSDFGLAKSLEANALAATAMTSAGQVLGTPRYMSPEQVECGAIDGRTDIYSFGLMLYEMVTGDLPFQGNSLQLMLGRVQSIPRNPTVLNSKLPPYLAGIIMRCLEKDAARRYGTFSEVLDDLENERFTPLGKTPAKSKSWTRRAVIAAVAVVAIASATPVIRHYLPLIQGARIQLGSSAAPVPDKHLAVLPFKVEGDDAKLAELALGLNEALYAKFYGLNDVQIASPAAVQKIAANASLQKAARDLGANLLITGTIQGSGDRVQIIVNLDDAAKGQHLFTQAFSGVRQDLLTLEDQIYSKLVNAVTSKPTNESLARVSLHQTENFAAYELYLKGRAAMRDQLNAESVKKAIGFYEQAVKTDSNFAMAYAGIADSDLRMYRSTKDRQWADHAVSAAQQAQSLNESLPEAYFALGSAYLATGKTVEAVSTLKRAIDLAPNSDEGYRRLGDAFKSTGNEAEALAAYNRAIQLNPYYWFNYNALGSAALKFNQNDEALKAFQKVIELEPDNVAGYQNLSVAYFNLGQFEKCIPVLQKSLELDKSPISYTNLGTVFFYLKRYPEAVPQFEEAVRLDPQSVENVGNLADAYRWSGKTQQANATYERAIEVALKALAVNPRDSNRMGQIAEYYAKKGDNAHAQTFIRRARSVDSKDVTLMYVQAVVDEIAGREPDALRNAEQALKNGYSLDDLQRDPELAKLQLNPEFKAFLKSLPPAAK
jgi:eukaryotic-like serine/threonine-protein kinase